MLIKSVKMKISKNKKMRLFLMSQGSLNPKIKFPDQKVCPVARAQTDGRMREWKQRTSFQYIIKDRSIYKSSTNHMMAYQVLLPLKGFKEYVQCLTLSLYNIVYDWNLSKIYKMFFFCIFNWASLFGFCFIFLNYNNPLSI